jgi:uncharacterized protein YqcC (DUF446 family)
MITIMNPLTWGIAVLSARRAFQRTPPRQNLLAHHEPFMTGFMNPLSWCFVRPQIHQGSDLVFCPTAKIS